MRDHVVNQDGHVVHAEQEPTETDPAVDSDDNLSAWKRKQPANDADVDVDEAELERAIELLEGHYLEDAAELLEQFLED